MNGRTLSVLLLLSSGACGPTGYACLDSEQCVRGELRGVCQPSGSCSFPDGACDSGQRYGSLSDEGFAGQCVPLDGETDRGNMTTDTQAGGMSGGGEEEGSTSSAETSGPPGMTSSSAGRRNPSENTSGPPDPPDPPDPACLAYCEVKDDCGHDTPACMQACQSAIEHAFTLGNVCGEALETLRDCRRYQSCEDLEHSFYEPISSDCGVAYEALGQACTQSSCVGLCSAVQDCGGGPLPPPPGNDGPSLSCSVECSARALDIHLEGGRVPCGQAFGTLLECISALPCDALLAAVQGVNSDACSAESSVVKETCPDAVNDR